MSETNILTTKKWTDDNDDVCDEALVERTEKHDEEQDGSNTVEDEWGNN